MEERFDCTANKFRYNVSIDLLGNFVNRQKTIKTGIIILTDRVFLNFGNGW
ncbi:hypothetical protein [Chryseobacterium sp. CT-SW4]|uniref:hypothetical protein n=1 Tax=Chryseobacterium sp. SW-1 TaxID=3157343 RepID=UPI003B019A9F